MTPRQAYSALKEEGFHVNYMRTPLTDGAAPREIVFDTFYTGVSAASPLDPVIFNDQMGAGRTTTGMVIACMIRSFMDPGAPLPGCVLRHAQPHLVMQGIPAVGSVQAPPRGPRSCCTTKDDRRSQFLTPMPFGVLISRTTRPPAPRPFSPLTPLCTEGILLRGPAP